MYHIIHDLLTFIVEVAILVYVAAEYYSSKRLEDKLAERLKRRKAIVKAAPIKSETTEKITV